MEKAKRIGIWMDHASAHLIEFTSDQIEPKTIESAFTHDVKENALNNKGESQIHVKEKHLQANYYKKLGEEIINYQGVLLFGPTNAKVELFNVLNADRRFANIKIDVKQADKMTENQEQAFVRNYFSK